MAAPEVLKLPLLIDAEAGRIYAATTRDGTDFAKTAVLSAATGRLLDTFDVAGPMALDAPRHRLAVDQGDKGLAILDAATGAVLTTVSLPALPESTTQPPSPQADPTTGQVYAMRGNAVYQVDPETGEVKPLAEFDLRPQDGCRPQDTVLPITQSFYDQAKRILYLGYVSYSCIPYVGYAVIVYAMDAGVEIGRWGGSTFAAAVAGGRFYADDWYRMGSGTLSALQEGQPWKTSTNWSGGARPLAIDSTQNRLIWDSGDSLRVFDAGTMRLLMVISRPYPDTLAGYDPVTDQLYFLAGRNLQPYPAGDVAPPQPVLPAATVPPDLPVFQLTVSPSWPQDKTLAGIWGYTATSDACTIWGGHGGTIYLSDDGGRSWRVSSTGLPPDCPVVSTLRMSPDYARDRALVAGLDGAGIFRSADGGASSTAQIVYAPGIAVNRPVFLLATASYWDATPDAMQSALFRSLDGGQSWLKISAGEGVVPTVLAISPAFAQDGLIFVGTADGQVMALDGLALQPSLE